MPRPTERRESRSWLRLVLAGGAITTACACGLFFDVDALGRGGAEGAPPNGDADSAGQEGESDAPVGEAGPGEPPPDSACKAPWSTAHTTPECRARRVAVVADDFLVAGTYVSVARTPGGRVGVLYNSASSADQDDLHLSSFVESGAWPPVFQRVTRTRDAPWHVGDRARMQAGDDETLHVLFHEHPAYDPGPILYMRLEGGAASFSVPELAGDAIPFGTHVGVARAASGDLYGAWYVKGTPTDGGVLPGKLAGAVRPAGGAFAAPTTIANDIAPGPPGDAFSDGPRVGQSSIAVDGASVAHLLLQTQKLDTSLLRYYVSSGSGWSPPKLVDYTISDADARVFRGPRIALRGNDKIAAYVTYKKGDKSAEVRVATWDVDPDAARVEVVAQGLSIANPDNPTYRLAMSIDPWGLVHLALVWPSSFDDVGSLEYIRQTRVGGGTTWLSDTVDDDVLSQYDVEAAVDLAIDARGRPHIAYRSAKTGTIYYATRLDR